MKKRFRFDMLPQPDATTCGPTCLHAVYQYYGDRVPLEQVITEVKRLDEGGTLAVFLGCHALSRGYRARIYTYNLQLFDPTWFGRESTDLAAKLRAQAEVKDDAKLRLATQGYLEYLERGGEIVFRDLTDSLFKKYLYSETPMLTGLSATYLYRSMREYGRECAADDVRGDPSGHFVVLCGYEKRMKKIKVADPWRPNPISAGGWYYVGVSRLIHSIMLGIVTYDANLLIVTRDLKGTH